MTRYLLVAALGAALPGCERSPAALHGSETVLARVNGAEISLASLPGQPPATRRAMRAALDRVIGRELLVQRALALGLERDAQVAREIDAARRQILAQAYLETLSTGPVSAEQAHAFYAENPALFAERRIYRIRELVVSAPAELVDELRAQAAHASSLDEVAAWLRERDARFSAASLSQPAEELPLAYLPRLARMKDGEIGVFSRPAYDGFPGGASVIELEHAEDAPLSQAEARPLIERFLAARLRLEAAAAEVRRLRRTARIQYTEQLRP